MKKREFLGWAKPSIHGAIFTISCGTLVLLFATAAKAAEKQVLRGHVPTAVTELNLQPVGRLPSTNRLHLAIGLPLRNQDALGALIKQIYDPASPQYHQYLTPEQFTEKFGPTKEDYAAVIAFAKANGLAVTTTFPNRALVDVEGTVADVEKALHVTMRLYKHPTEARTFHAPDTEPSLDLAVPVLHVGGLDNYILPHPLDLPVPPPGCTNACTGSGPYGTYMGRDFRAAYAPGTTLTGSGQIVGLLEFDGYTASDITAYEALAGLPNVTLTNVLIDGADGGYGGYGGDRVEVSLDIEMAISMAPGVSAVVLYMAPNPSPWEDLMQRMANDNLAKQISCSWYGGGGGGPAAEQALVQMAAQGQSFFCASGDSDAFINRINSILFPSDCTNVTSVGGTTLTTTCPGGAWASETVWNWGIEYGSAYDGIGSGGGISTSYSIPPWQQGVSMTNNQGSTTMRNIPDVALIADCVWVMYGDGDAGAFGGTSCAAPLWAGFIALVNQQAAGNGKPTVGFINPAIYAIGQSASYTNCFHDITTGNNTWSESTNQFYAVPGYDLCTGWGTPTGSNLINALVGNCGGPYSITTSSSPVGGGSTSGGGTVACGFNVTVCATPNACYSFVNWTDQNSSVVSTTACYTFTATNSETLVANFTPIVSCTITVQADPTDGGTVSGGGTVACGSSVTVCATPNACYSFVNWTLWTTNGIVVSDLACCTFAAPSNETLVANFTPIVSCTITTSSSPANGGTTSGGGTKGCSSSVTVTASANASCYSFANWTLNGSNVSDSASYTFAAPSNETLVANFTLLTNYTITTSSSPTNGGTTTGGGTVACGSNVTVCAANNAGYRFVNWTLNGNVVTNSACYTLTAANTETLVANFASMAFLPGDIVVLRIGDGTQPVTNLGQTVFLDEYTPAAIASNAGGWGYPTPRQSIQMPTNWVGAQAPLIADATALGEGQLSRSADGRFLVLTGFGATLTPGATPTYQITNGALESATVTGLYNQVARVVGLVDGFGRIYTSTVQTNGNEEGDDIRVAASLDGTNIWLVGSANGVKYTTRGSMLSTQVCSDITLSPLRAANIYSNTLYIDTATQVPRATNTSGAYNLTNGVALPTSYVWPNFVAFPGVGPTISAFGFAMFNLNNANQGGAAPDTLYVADSLTNFPGEGQGGAVLKYCYVGGSWVWEGTIGAEAAYGVAGYQNGQTVTLYITEGANNTLYTYTDTSGYGNAVYDFALSELAFVPSGGNASLVNVRGIAVVPQGGDSGGYIGATNGPGALSIGPPFGPYFRGPQGGPFQPTNGVAYSVANLGSSTTNFNVSFPGANWMTATPSSGTLPSGASTTVTITPNANAASQNGGVTYTGNVVFKNGLSGGNPFASRLATLVVDAFYVNPTTNYISVGEPGGPFTPSSIAYALSNATPNSLNFTAYLTNGAWASVSPTSGSVNPYSSQNITISITTAANSMTCIGSYVDQLIVTNTTANTVIPTEPIIILQVGFGFFDDFSTDANGNVVGQNNWLGDLTAIHPVQIVNGLYTVPGGCPNNNGTSQQPYKYVAAGALTNPAAYAILGMSVTFTNGSPSPNCVFALDNVFLPWDDAGIQDVGGGKYVWTTELNTWETGRDVIGTLTYSYNTAYQVFLVADFVNSNAWVFVNPGTSDFVSMLSTTAPAVHATGGETGCSYCTGASPEGWTGVIVGQTSSCPDEVQQGYMISRLAASTNDATVYKWLNLSAAPVASFTATPTNGPAPSRVNFTNTSTGSPTSWSWTFGDGNVSTNQNPANTYTNAGTYTASLIVTNSCGVGSTNTATATISVYDPYAWWQMHYFNSTSCATCGGDADFDGDGMSNTNEFLAGFNPTNSAAYLHIISIATTNTTDINVIYLGANGDNTWSPGIASRTNVLEFTAGAADGSYSNNFVSTGQSQILGGGTGLGIVTNMVDAGGATSTPSRYYRVRVLLP